MHVSASESQSPVGASSGFCVNVMAGCPLAKLNSEALLTYFGCRCAAGLCHRVFAGPPGIGQLSVKSTLEAANLGSCRPMPLNAIQAMPGPVSGKSILLQSIDTVICTGHHRLLSLFSSKRCFLL